MSALRIPEGLVLGFHPTSRGFGWVAFESPFQPFDWGLIYARGDKNATCLIRLESLLDRLKPDVLVIEEFDRRTTRRANRIARLQVSVAAAAAMRNIEVANYTLADIRLAFAEAGATSRREIIETVARHVDAFRHRLPPPRKPWESEDRRSALFAAAALVLTHFRAL